MVVWHRLMDTERGVDVNVFVCVLFFSEVSCKKLSVLMLCAPCNHQPIFISYENTGL